jgi:methionine-rich copper-binding protein CopC
MVLLISFSNLQFPSSNIGMKNQVNAAVNVSNTSTLTQPKEKIASKMETEYPSVTETLEGDSYVVPPDEAAVLADYYWLDETLVCMGEYPGSITTDLIFPLVGENGSTINWSTSDATLVETDGTVHRPAYSTGNKDVAITANITKGEAILSREFIFTIITLEPNEVELVSMTKEWLTASLVLNGNDYKDVKTKLNLPQTREIIVTYPYKEYDINISWESSDITKVALDGSVIRPAKDQEDVPITLTATIQYNGESVEKTFDFIVTKVEEFQLAIMRNDFSNLGDKYQFNGLSGIMDTLNREGNSIKALQFYNDGLLEGGSVFTSNKIHLSNDMSFSTAFSYRNVHPQYTKGNGGFTFTIQAEGSGEFGQNSDSFGTEGISPSLNIAFGTVYSSWPGSGQSTYYGFTESVKVFYNGNNDATNENSRVKYLDSGNTNNPPTFNNVWIEYDGSTNILEIRFSKTLERPKQPTLQVENVNLGEIFTSQNGSFQIKDVQDVYVGFTGSTGNAKDKSEISSLYFKNNAIPIDFAPYDFIDASNVVITADPAAGASSSTVTVTVIGDNGPVVGIPVEFTTTLGTLNDTFAVTNSAGKASVLLSTVLSGTAIVRTNVAGGASSFIEVQLALSDEDKVNFDNEWLSDTRVLNGNKDLNNIISKVSMPTLAPNGSTISWTTSDASVIALDGTVVTPSPTAGDQKIILKATISLNAVVVTRVFDVTVKVLNEDIVTADRDWLTDILIQEGNSNLNEITKNLFLPIIGNYGSTISWSSTNEMVVSSGGEVVQPTYTQGEQKLELIATISKGQEQTTKKFNITVKTLAPTDEEAVIADNLWLTDERIRQSNIDFNNITEALDFPTIGPRGSTIIWTSTNETVINTDGAVSQPSYTQGYKKVTITATISRGTEATFTKSFKCIVIALNETEDEALAADVAWLNVSNTLWKNLSQYAINGDLVLPTAAPKGAFITWSSSMPEVISTNGIVKRPEFVEGHKSVTMVATLKMGDKEISKEFVYTVLSLPDIIPPQIVTSVPANNSIEINYDTREIIIIFNEEIKQGALAKANLSTYGIIINAPSAPGFFARIDKNKLIIRLYSNMKDGEKQELIIPRMAVTDMSGNPLEDDFKLNFSVERRLVNKIEVISSNPVDKENQFSTENELSFCYSYNEIFESSKFNNISLRTRDGAVIKVTKILSGNKITLDLGTAKLIPGTAYELVIPAGAVNDRFGNSSSEKTIQFITKSDKLWPEIIHSYPINDQKTIDVNQSIRLNFSEKVKVDTGIIKLKDANGNIVDIAIGKIDTILNVVTITPFKPLQPNTEYTIYVPYNFVKNNSGNHMQFDYSTSFQTGASLVDIVSLSPNTFNKKGVSINTPIEIKFASPVIEGLNYTKMKILDSKGNSISFLSKETDNAVILTPISSLAPSETYTVEIPSGAFANGENAFNDDLRLYFTTAEKLNLSSYSIDSFIVKPSPKWLVKKTLTFSADRIESVFKSIGSNVISYEWSFGDGNIGTGKNVDHIYFIKGNYTVKLKIEDSNGICYELEQLVKIGDFDSSEVRMTVSPYWSEELLLADSYDNSQKGYKLYTISLSYDGRYISDEEVKVLLYQNGELVENLGTVTTGRGNNKYIDEWGYTYSDIGTAFFRFWYKYKKIIGNYELVFVYGTINGNQTTGKVVRIPITISDTRSKQNLNIKLYNKNNGTYVDYITDMPFLIDGVQRFAKKKWISEEYGYCYVIENVDITFHTLQLSSSHEYSFYTSNKEVIMHGGAADVVILPVERKKIGITRIKSEASDTNKRWNSVFLKGINMQSLHFEFESDWNYLEPGYYEITTSKNRFTKRTVDPWTDLNPSYLEPGEKLLVRMVARSGITSPWMDAKVEAVWPPELNTDLNINYVNGEYLVDSSMNLGNIVGDSISVIDDMPLLGHSKSFGLDGSNLEVEGVMKINGSWKSILLKVKASGSVTTKKKKPKMVSVGYEMTTDVNGIFKLVNYGNLSDWQLEQSEFTVMGDLSKYWKIGYRVPKIDIGAEGQLYVGAIAGGTLYIDKSAKSDEEYSGILYFEPYVYGSIFAGLDWVSVEGIVDGRIPSEVHIPTGYIQAEPSITAKIKGTFAFYSKTLYSKKLETHWDNGKKKVTAPKFSMESLPIEFETDESELTQMPRTYLNRKSNWFGKNTTSSIGMSPLVSYSQFIAKESNSSVVTMKDNIFPYSDVKLVQNKDELWMIWTDDNPERSTLNRTQLKYSVLSDGNWSEPVWIDNDGTADFTPVTATTGNGVLMAWQNISKPIWDGAQLNETIENAEISVTKNVNKTDGSNVEIITLTDDDKFDHSPKLAANGDQALLVWTKSEGLSFTLGDDMDVYKSSDNSDCLMSSSWNGTTWSSPVLIQDSLPTVVSSSLSIQEKEGMLLYTLDNDNDLSTQSDQEIYARIYKGSSWGEAIQITENYVSDSNAKAVYSNGDWFITWYQDRNIRYRLGLSGENKAEEFLNDVQSNYEITVSNSDKPQIALVYQQIGEKSSQNLSTALYDIDKGVWSQEMPLTEGEGYVRTFSPIFTNDGKLNIAYTNAEVITEVVEGEEYYTTSDKVDLCMLTYNLVHDLALMEEDGLQLSQEIPYPSTLVTVTATIRNQGNFAEKATVYLYDGTPEEGVKIGEVTTEQAIPARSSSEVEIEWIVDSKQRDKYDLHAVVHMGEGDKEIDFDNSNNMIHHEISTSDIAITSLECDNIANNDYLVTAVISNKGAQTLDGIQIQLMNEDNILESREYDQLSMGQQVKINFLISSDGLAKDADGNINLTLRALLPDEVEENSKDNNIYDFTLVAAPIVVESMNPGHGETQVGIQDTLSLIFNMNVDKGIDFEQITLEDENFNKVDISKTIEGDTLSITPRNEMEYDTKYTLIIPKEALSDTYGHTMEDNYSLSFATITRNPEIVFAYPGNELDKVELDTDIKIKYNKSVTNGPTFEEIVLYGPQSQVISTSVSLQGEWLYINPSVDLKENTAYSLVIPNGAVKDAKEVLQQEDYALEFTTGMVDNDGGYSEDNEERIPYKITRQIAVDGSSTAFVTIDEKGILMLNSEKDSMACLNLLDEVKQDKTIRINLALSALEQLIKTQRGFNIITGKGDIWLPPELVKSLADLLKAQEGKEESLDITIGSKGERVSENEMVSSIFEFLITVGEQQVTKFMPEVIVTIPIHMTGVSDPEKVIACVYDEETNMWKPVGGVADATGETLSFYAKHFSSYAAFETNKTFSDVIADWARDEIETLASRGLIYGITNNSYKPEGSITRAEFTALIVRSLYMDSSKSKDTFTDVSKDSWYTDAVETAYELELIFGTTQDRFEPNKNINREELATIVYRLYQYKGGKEIPGSSKITLTDQSEISSYAKEAVNFTVNSGIMVGNGDKFEPQRSTTRQEAAVVIYRLLKYLKEL